MTLFKDKDHVQDLLKRADNIEETKQLTAKFQQLKKERTKFYLTANELDEILQWKLRKQVRRQQKKRIVNTDDNIKIITEAAFAVSHVETEIETTLKLKLLSALTGVEVPVASAILTLCYPKQYSVIDFRNWRQVFNTDKRKATYTGADYNKYLKKIKKWAKNYKLTPQEIDIAIWQKDIETKKK